MRAVWPAFGLAVFGCAGPPVGDDATQDEPVSAIQPDASSLGADPEVDDSAPVPLPVADDCASLSEAASEHPHDAYALAMLCPEAQLSPTQQRAALMQAATPPEIERVLARVDAGSELAALGRLLALDGPKQLPERLDDPARASVTPLDDGVVARAALAHAIYVSSSVSADDRTRAQAYLAKVHLHALQSLGSAPGRPLDPLARVLAARALHHGRTFCRAYWQRRVRGLDGLFRDVEARLLDAVLLLEASPHAADSALLAVERQRSRQYVLGAGERLERARTTAGFTRTSAEDLQGFPDELDRLLDHGFVDLAIARAIHRGREKGGYGLLAAEQALTAAIQARGSTEFESKLESRLREARASATPPPETGPRAIEARGERPYPSAESTADEAQRWLETAPARGLGRRRAIVRALLLLRDRPDSLALLLDRTGDRPALRPHAGLLLALALALDPDTLPDEKRLARARAQWSVTDRDGKETRTRRRMALAFRHAGRSPR